MKRLTLAAMAASVLLANANTAQALDCVGNNIDLETQAEVTVDGHPLGEIVPGDRLEIRASEQRTTLIHPPGYDFYDILRSKLLWGRDSRTRAG